jgi:aryl-alcohol dehydrogenase-like predicted oxidoreductase
MHTSRRDLFRLAIAAATANGAAAQHGKREPEWRNRQPGMSYRPLGRTGMMISEIVSGGDPIRTGNWQHLEVALELGLNYLDMAPAYGRGECETAFGKLLAGSSSRRMKVFLTTKVSVYRELRGRMYKEIFDGLPGDQQTAVMQRVEEIRRNSIGEKPGYFIEYYPGQGTQFAPVYLAAAMAPDYSHRVEGSPEFRKVIRESIEGSLKRVGTDHFDILMCPHGACSAAELENPYIYEMFLGLKAAGKVRFLGVTSHNDPATVLRKAAQLGWYDVAMVAYNVLNGGYLEMPIMDATSRGMGVIAMKAAHAVATHHKALQPIPSWRTEKVNRIVPGDLKPALKGYLWALQNTRIAGVISNLWDEAHVRENLALAGKKVKLQPA